MILQILPEIFCFIISVVFLMMSFGKPRHENLYRMGMLFCFVNILIVAFTLPMSGLFFYESYKIDLFSQSVKLLLCIGLFFVVFMTDSRSDGHIRKNFP